MSHLKELDHACNVSCMEAHGKPCYSHRELLVAIKVSIKDLLEARDLTPSKELYERIFTLAELSEQIKKVFDPRAGEIALAKWGQGRIRFQYTKTDVYEDTGYDHPNSFKAEWLWDPDWRTRLEEFRAEEKRRLDRYMEQSRKADEERVKKTELAELARLKAKYPNA